MNFKLFNGKKYKVDSIKLKTYKYYKIKLWLNRSKIHTMAMSSKEIFGYVKCMAKHMAMQCIIYVKSILGRFDELHICKTSMLTQTSVWKVPVSLLKRYERYMHMQLIHKSNGCLLWHVHTYITCHAYVHINTRVCIIWNMDRNVNANFPQTL